MTALLRGVFIVGAKRTPFGTFGGKLKDFTATHLGALASIAALENAKVKPEQVNSVTFGCVNQFSSKDGIYITRHIALRSGMPNAVPCLTVNRLCGSGFQAVVTGCQEICLREAEIVLAGGAESMSQVPYCVREIRFGTKFGTDYKKYQHKMFSKRRFCDENSESYDDSSAAESDSSDIIHCAKEMQAISFLRYLLTKINY